MCLCQIYIYIYILFLFFVIIYYYIIISLSHIFILYQRYKHPSLLPNFFFIIIKYSFTYSHLHVTYVFFFILLVSSFQTPFSNLRRTSIASFLLYIPISFIFHYFLFCFFFQSKFIY